MSDDRPADYWQYFIAETERANAPLYTKIVRGIAADEQLKELAGRVPEGQPPANVLLAAVHYRLLEGARHPLRRFYPNLNGGGRTGGEDPFPVFRDFVKTDRAHLLPLIETGVTNTNEIGRCSALHPGFRVVAKESGQPLHLIEIGPSAGLNLRWDDYRVCYRRGQQNFEAGPPNSELILECALRGEKIPPLGPNPEIASRVGLERNPVDLSRPTDRNWLKALVWPDHLARFERLEKAIELFRANPAEIRFGDALDLLPDTIASLPEAQPVCVYHTFVVYQFSVAMRAALDNILIGASLRRPVWRLSVEGSPVLVGEAPIRLRHYAHGHKQSSRVLGTCHPHGSWLDWRS